MKALYKQLETKIKNSYEQGVTLEQAERLASEFLHAQLAVSAELTKADLDSRMRKSGVKAVRSAIYLNIVSSADKKPTESHIESTLNTDKLVIDEQEALDKAEVTRDELKRYYDIFLNAHIFFRGIAKGKFE